MKFPHLFSYRDRITLIDCQVGEDSVVAKLAWIAPNLEIGNHQLKENAISPICEVSLPEWAISDEPLVFLEPIKLEIIND